MSLCDIYYLWQQDLWHAKNGLNFQMISFKKGDVMVLTVDLE